MKEYIPKDKVLELWWYWKFIEAYDDTKAMKGIDLDDYVPREWHDRVCEEMAKHHMRHKMLDDGTLVVSVDDATKVTRVLVEDSKKNGDLYYADRFEADVVEVIDDNVIMSEETYNGLIEASVRPKGEWIDTGKDKKHLHPLSARWYRCSVCGLETNAKTNYCFDCGADMSGADDE